MVSVLEKWQLKALELEKQMKEVYTNKKLAKQFIIGARQDADLVKTDKDAEWYVKYCAALESRL